MTKESNYKFVNGITKGKLINFPGIVLLHIFIPTLFSIAMPIQAHTSTQEPYIDLIGKDIKISKTLSAGSKTLVTNYILNTGTASTNYMLTGYYLSKDTTLNKQEDIKISENYVSSPIAGKQCIQQGVYISIPDYVTEGKYYFLVEADMGNSSAEINENNNVSYEILNIKYNLPDFYINEVQYPAIKEVYPLNFSITVHYNLWNFGPVSTQNSYTGFYLVKDKTFDINNAQYLGQKEDKDQGSESTNIRIATFEFSVNNIPGGLYYIAFVADHKHAFLESNESNNVSYIPVILNYYEKPELVILKRKINTCPDNITHQREVELGVLNIGKDSVRFESTLTVLLTNPDNSYNNELINVEVNKMKSNEYISNPLTIQIPEGLENGTYILKYIVDSRDNVSELDEENNEESDTIFINNTITNFNKEDIEQSISISYNQESKELIITSDETNYFPVSHVLINSSGFEVMKIVASEKHEKINCQNLPFGLYFLKSIHGNSYFTKKIFIP